jgi:hypothetical protein
MDLEGSRTFSLIVREKLSTLVVLRRFVRNQGVKVVKIYCFGSCADDFVPRLLWILIRC